MERYGTDELLVIAKNEPVDTLPHLIGLLSEGLAIANRRLLTPTPAPTTPEPPQLIDRKQAAALLGVSVFFLEGKHLPCQQRAGRKVLYDRRKLEEYIRRGNVPYSDR